MNAKAWQSLLLKLLILVAAILGCTSQNLSDINFEIKDEASISISNYITINSLIVQIAKSIYLRDNDKYDNIPSNPNQRTSCLMIKNMELNIHNNDKFINVLISNSLVVADSGVFDSILSSIDDTGSVIRANDGEIFLSMDRSRIMENNWNNNASIDSGSVTVTYNAKYIYAINQLDDFTALEYSCFYDKYGLAGGLVHFEYSSNIRCK